MTKMKEKVVTLCAILLGAWVLASSPLAAHAQGPHPHYLHAIADLKAARGQLQGGGWQRPGHAQAAHEVLDEIDHAINDLKYASTLDNKNTNIPIPPDASGSPEGRLHSALDFLSKAYQDVSGPESDPAAYKSQAAALQRIDRSRNVLKFAINGK